MTAPNEYLNENALRPDVLMRESWRLHASDLEWLRERRGEFVTVECPACGRSQREPHWEKVGFTYARCGACQTVYLDPRPQTELMTDYYRQAQNYRFWDQHVFPASEQTRREQLARPRVARILDACRRFAVKTDLLVEVGAGHGTFGAEATRSGAFGRVIAIEPTPSLAESCRARGLEVFELPVEHVALPADSVDVITSFEVIEHLFSPAEFLRSCRRLLRPGGLIVLSCPNVLGFDVVVTGSRGPVVDPEHMNYFHPRSLGLLVDRCGFDVLEITTPGQLDAELVRKDILSGEFDASSQPFLKQILVDEWERLGRPFQEFLAANLLSSHMWIVARRKDRGERGRI